MDKQAAAKPHVSAKSIVRIYPASGNYPPLKALGPIDLDLKNGEFFSVVGPSGCGKSTLLDVIAGLSVPTDGAVLFEDRPVLGSVPDGVGIVFQEDSSFPWLTVFDNAAFGLRRQKAPESHVRERVNDALRLTGLMFDSQTT